MKTYILFFIILFSVQISHSQTIFNNSDTINNKQITNVLTGKVVYYNTVNTVIGGITLNLLSGTTQIASTTTDINGLFTFSNIPNGTYTFTATTPSAWGGVNATDALKIKRHIAGLELLTEPISLSAADVNNSETITSTDALKMQLRIASIDTSFTKGNWVFEKPFVGGNTITINSADTNITIYALCTGDVNRSYVPPNTFSQYQSIFGTNNTSWKIVVTNTGIFETDSLRTGNDTLINGLQYKKIISDYIVYNPQHIHGFLREDINTGRVWYKGWYSSSPHPLGDSTERLIMDMSLTVGDSFYFSYYRPYPLDTGWLKVDSIYYLFGKKYVQLEDSTATYWGGKLLFIEGIGPNLGIQYLSNNLNGNPYLLCSYKNNAEVYQNNNPNFNGCNLIPTNFKIKINNKQK